MTTLAINKNQMAADRMVNHAGMQYKMKSKIFSFNNPVVYPVPFHVGVSGNLENVYRILEYFVDPETWEPIKKFDSVECLVLTTKGKLFTFSDPRKWSQICSTFYALGTGAHFAMGAMAAGKTPLEAVKIAATLDKGSGNGFTSVTL